MAVCIKSLEMGNYTSVNIFLGGGGGGDVRVSITFYCLTQYMLKNL